MKYHVRHQVNFGLANASVAFAGLTNISVSTLLHMLYATTGASVLRSLAPLLLDVISSNSSPLLLRVLRPTHSSYCGCEME